MNLKLHVPVTLEAISANAHQQEKTVNVFIKKFLVFATQKVINVNAHQEINANASK